MKEPIKRSLASYRTKSGSVCDVDKLAKLLSSIGNVPERVNFTKAAEISLLARAYLSLRKSQDQTKKREE